MGSTFLELLEKSNIADLSRAPGTDRFTGRNPLLLWAISPQICALTSFSHRSFGACISTDITPQTYCRTLCLVSLIRWTWLTARWSSHMMMFRWESPSKNKERGCLWIPKGRNLHNGFYNFTYQPGTPPTLTGTSHPNLRSPFKRCTLRM